MRRRLHNVAQRSSEMRALYVLLVFLARRARCVIPTLRPQQMVMPATILQIVVFLLAAVTPGQFVIKFAVGNFIIAAALMLPLMLKPAEVKVHWVKPQE